MDQSNLHNPILVTSVIAILVKRLGGTVTITQSDLDSVAYARLNEDGYSRSGELTLTFIERKRSD